jgi:hypothetical protein
LFTHTQISQKIPSCAAKLKGKLKISKNQKDQIKSKGNQENIIKAYLKLQN